MTERTTKAQSHAREDGQARTSRVRRSAQPGPGFAADVLALQRSAGNRAVGGLVQRVVNPSNASGLTGNMTALFIDRHVLSTPASTAVNPANVVPPRQKPDGSYVRDRSWGNTGAAYRQALNRFNNLAGGQTHVVEMPNAYPEYSAGKRMKAKTAKRVIPGHVEMVVDAGWKFSKVPAAAGTPGLSENVATVASEAVLESTSASSRTAVVGVAGQGNDMGKINHFPAEHNPFLH